MNLDNLVLAVEHLAGLLVVMFALSCLWALAALMGWVVTRFERRAAERAKRMPDPVATPVEAEPETDDDAVVVAATAMMLLGPKARVVAVQPLASSWGDQGRRDIHVSHRFR